MTVSKNHTISKIIAKAILRITIILLAIPIIVYFTNRELLPANLNFQSIWSIAAPILLFLLFTALLIVVLRNKFTQVDFNWMFSLCGAFLCAYLLLLYIQSSPLT
ncbi:hypothetical protein [Sphingobacterium wenxiniae]|uniref:Uncharacterized protein n=1 Tax=Sphingobacterium wenxiniae TaxID=683125 RepID=A0A1I6R257_9SPHI|nr:hypothetical protein [Sphingobacterium wenxiniae]SFS58753.1 hypothetical protein SAMN05660206_10331 [Sphingobacterium wenxiniae]